jgi:hypothetical protein
MDFEDWMRYGIEHDFCGPPVCSTHDGVPTTEDDDAAFDDGDDPCIHVIRPYYDADEKAAVEANHSPSVWRNHYTEGTEPATNDQFVAKLREAKKGTPEDPWDDDDPMKRPLRPGDLERAQQISEDLWGQADESTQMYTTHKAQEAPSCSCGRPDAPGVHIHPPGPVACKTEPVCNCPPSTAAGLELECPVHGEQT